MKNPELFTLAGLSFTTAGIIQPLVTAAHVHPQTFIPMASVVAGAIVIGASVAILLDDLLAEFLDTKSSTLTTLCATALLATLIAAITAFAGMANWMAIKIIGVAVVVILAGVVAFILHLQKGAATDDEY